MVWEARRVRPLGRVRLPQLGLGLVSLMTEMRRASWSVSVMGVFASRGGKGDGDLFGISPFRFGLGESGHGGGAVGCHLESEPWCEMSCGP